MRLILAVLITISFSCNKIVEETAETLITDLIINYDWYVNTFQINGKDSTHLFDNYTFDFQENDKVVARYSGNSYNGSWLANTSLFTIESNFVEDIKPLQLLSNTWSILGTTTTTVRATTIKDGITYNMRLHRVDY